QFPDRGPGAVCVHGQIPGLASQAAQGGGSCLAAVDQGPGAFDRDSRPAEEKPGGRHVTFAPRRGPDWFAVVAVTITVVIHEILTALNHRPNVLFIVSAALFWVGFALVRARQDPAILDAWGFRKKNL